MLKSALILPALLAASAASAQDGGWNYRATLYAWLPGLSATVDTSLGEIETGGGGDGQTSVLDLFNMAFMGTFSAQHDPWTLSTDLLYADLSGSQDTPLPLYGDGTLGIKLGALSGYALYRVTQDSPVQVDAGVGFRSFDLTTRADLEAGLLPAASAESSANWTDLLIAAKVTVPMGEKWFLSGFADLGGSGGADDQTYQAYAGLGYNFTPAWSAQLGYRYMNLQHEVGSGNAQIGLGGFLVAMSYNF